jgi:hypothetical protein
MTVDDERFGYHGSGCQHTACRHETAELAVARVKERQRYELKTRVDFDPLSRSVPSCLARVVASCGEWLPAVG